MPHDPNWHIRSDVFTDSNAGLTTPTRNLGGLGSDGVDVSRTAEQQDHVNTLVVAPHGLRIDNLDRADPPGYKADDYPRSSFNRNVYQITATPRMPVIQVQCQARGFDPASTPIYWRLQCRHVLCRFTNTGGYRYDAVSDTFNDEWQGRSRSASFTLFGATADANVTYDYNTSGEDAPVMGGHVILSVASRPSGAGVTLLDYVHVRVGGTNPAQNDVLQYIQAQLAGRDANIVSMVRAVFAHESAYQQFSIDAQTRTHMNFTRKHHNNDPNQPDCRTRFDWPDDPANFPSVSFDYGVGISQYTRVGGQVVTREIAWDWRENIKIGINTLFDKMRATRHGKTTWSEWALAAWARYNGTGAAAQAYAQELRASTDGQAVSSGAIPATFVTNQQCQALTMAAARPAPPAWPPAQQP